MPSNLKKLIRARMEKTGESHQTAMRHVRERGTSKETAALELVVRPFHEFIEHGEGRPVSELRGRIERGRFMVVFMGEQISLATVASGSDKFGQYARVHEGELSFANGFRLRVEVDPEEPFMPGEKPSLGCHIMVYTGGRSDSALQAVLQATGLDPKSFNLLTPHEKSFSVYFNSAGNVNGRGSSGPWVQPTVATPH